MEGTSTPDTTCSQCGSSAGTGLIFCRKCGAVLRQPVSLVPSSSQVSDNPASVSAIKRTVIMIIKGIAGVAAVVFWFWRPTTNTNALVFGASIVVLLICAALLSKLDDNFIGRPDSQ